MSCVSSRTHRSANSNVFLFPTSMSAFTQVKVKNENTLLDFDLGSGTKALLLTKRGSTSLLSHVVVACNPLFVPEFDA